MGLWVLRRAVKSNPSTGGRNPGTNVSLALTLIMARKERPFPDGTDLVLRADYGYY